MDKPKILVFSLIIAFGMLMWASNAFATGTPANTDIINQASATYDDADGRAYTSNSNQVITTVQPVYDLTITPDGTTTFPGQTQNASQGATVYFQYILTNTGNAQDDFTIDRVNDTTDDFDPNNIRVYHDVNGNGLVDTGEPLVYNGSPGTLNDIDADATASLVMTYEIPVSATSGQVTRVDIKGTSVGNTSKVDTLNYNQTTVVDNAVIVGNKSVSVNEASPGDTLTYTINASNTGSKATTGDTLRVVVAGSADSLYGVIIADPLPTLNGIPFVIPDTSNVTGTPTAGTVIYWVGQNTPSYSDDLDGAPWTTGAWYDSYASAKNAEDATTSPPTYIRAVGFITGNTTAGSGTILASQSFSLEFNVRVPVDYPAGSVNNRARLEYDDADSVEHGVETNQVTTDIGGTGYEVLATMLSPSTQSNAHDLSVAGEDTLTISQMSAGETQNHTFTISNHGYSSDVINILPATAPSGWNVGYYYLDGVTPLGDTNGDGKVDLGSVGVGASISFIVKVTAAADQSSGSDSLVIIYAQSSTQPSTTLPSSSTTINMAGGYSDNADSQPDTLTLASSAAFNDGDFINITTSAGNLVRRIQAKLSGNRVVVPDLGANVANGANVTGSITTYNKSVIKYSTIVGPGVQYVNRDYSHSKNFTAHPVDSTYVDMPLRIKNTANTHDTYTLTDSLPTNWTVTYYHDADCDAVLDGSELSPITDIYLDAGDSACIFARVFFPANTPATSGFDYGTTFWATSTNDTTVSDVIHNHVQITANCQVLIDPDRSGTGTPGYTVEYYHNLINTGNTPITTSSYFTVSSVRGWSYVLYQEDPNTANQWDQLSYNAGTGRYTLAHQVGVNSTADSTSRIRVRVYIPSSAPDSQVETGVITIHAACGDTDNATDITTVIRSNLLLEKRVVNISASDTSWAGASTANQGAPDDTLIYYVHFQNISSGEVDTLIIYDAIPVYTTYIVGSAAFINSSGAVIANRQISFSNDNGASFGYTPGGGTGAEDSNVTNIKYEYYNTTTSSYIVLNPGEEGWIKFKVTID